MPIYPASMSALPQPVLVPARWQPLRVTAAVLCFVAMVLVLAGLFLPLYSGELSVGPGLGSSASLEMTYTPWSVEYSDPDLNAVPAEAPRVGYPMVFAVVILAGAACACWYAATPSASRTAGRAGGVVTAVAGAFLIGTAWTIAVQVTNAIDSFILVGSLNPGLNTDATYLVGYWVLLIATFLGFAAAVLALLPARQPAWQPSEGPYGFTGGRGTASADPGPGQAVAYAIDPMTGQLLPGPPVAPHTSVDPLTGEPLQPAGPTRQDSQPTVAATWTAAPGPMVNPLTGQPIPANGDPVTGLPSPAAGLPAIPGTAVDPLTGQPSPPGGFPGGAAPVPAGAADPWTGQPSSPAGAASAAAGAVDPLTGQPIPPASTSASAGATDPWTGHPAPATAASVTGQNLPAGFSDAGQPSTVDPLTGQPVPQAVPFTTDPVPSGNALAIGGPAVNGIAPIQLPEAPAPETPRGPAIPDSEDPLAEPPRT